VQLAKMNEFQVLGSAITYMRRYALSSALGIITDSDIDAAGEQIKGDTDSRIAGCKTQGDLTKLFSEINPKDAATIEKFTKRKLELSKNN